MFKEIGDGVPNVKVVVVVLDVRLVIFVVMVMLLVNVHLCTHRSKLFRQSWHFCGRIHKSV